ncbi:uncharacterized protein [Physcomitrium patens]|uniref:Uncharacterized protein n=1 Tax=Physcomitrium patens TaxID=3218 RepID=A0A2K1IB77_PHYPA|nr:epidermal growth factor receptor substrate 15-like 1 [Physcomitrium patens]XP_024366465.1 epidermal growth factor receptor substrate 15-like 1 [Physcomitrium patens]XP_024366466.1 epidermal growth factor receptor substrate 15-like 1 [Physcomitrium patens]XP_024366467.1 epidermal growth factor receptor substrate 15-like 1 [Physcomitrium patens]PNR26542.1 hypothetical protein PHYPA_030022 [Physcomitrium patens]|eukprot:XP_024366464.1 epidermal growth factor receptor substrate 15-like 1 [Physcomitrella patens]
MANAEVFDSYFRRADLDKDGRISGQEAVGFFQGAGLPQMTLAKIWQFADQGRTGYLSRVEFYNALKLVTVAQTGREITPELVRAALTGPAAAQIPPPRINTPAGQHGGPGGSPAPALSSQGAPSVRAPGPAAAYNGFDVQSRSLQGSNGGLRPVSMQGNGLSSSQGVYGAPVVQKFSPHTNSAPSAPLPQGGFGAPARQLAPQTNSLSTGGTGVPQLMNQTSSLPRYPPSAAQVQVPPAGLAQQGWARPPASGGAPVRPSLGSLFTTNSAWPSKDANPEGANQGPGSTSVSAGPTVLTTPSAGQSRPLTPGSAALTPAGSNAGSGTTSKSQTLDATSTNGGGFNSGIDLFSSGFKATSAVGTPGTSVGSSPASNMFPGGQATKPASVTPPAQQNKSASATPPAQNKPAPLDESMFSAPAVPSMQGPPQNGLMGMGAGAGSRPHGVLTVGDSWPQMSASDVQRYTRVFTKVDTDKDGKITGNQARELFLSWNLPRGVLKQVWDLSDQDNDSMLSLREFCTALYFMERFREGRVLPSTLPSGIHPDNLHVPVASIPQGPAVPRGPGVSEGSLVQQGSGAQSAPIWRHIPGAPQQASVATGADPAGAPMPPVKASPTLQMPERAVPAPGEVAPAAVQEPYKSKVPALEESLVGQLSRDEQEMLKTKHKAAEEADKKVFELDKEIQDYKEKTELYRTKLQEIILFKSRCDNQLNEVKESVATEKREIDTLSKKYDQKFKQAGEISSRLQAEEAAFRDIQEKKMELYTAIAKLDKGGDDNETLENRANLISAHLDDLKKTLYERGKALGVKPKSAIPIEVSTGFEGVPDNAMEWVEDWFNFTDEGFTNVRDIMDDMVEVPSTTKSAYSAPWGNGESLFDDGFDFSSEPTISDFKTGQDEEPFSTSNKVHADFRSAESTVFKSDFDYDPEHDVSTSDIHHKDNAFGARLPSARFDEGEAGGSTFGGEATFDTVSESGFGQGRNSFNSRDPFGDSSGAWAINDDDSNADFRASWVQARSSAPSTQTSMDLSSSRGQTRFGRERGSIADSLDLDPLRISSPRGNLFDGSIRIPSPGGFDSSRRESVSSPGARGFGGLSSPGWSFDRNGNGHDDYKSAFGAFDSPKSNAFGSPRNAFDSPKNTFGSPKNSSSFFGNSSFDATPSFFGGSPGGSKRDNPYSGSTFSRFDSFTGPGSPAAPARGSGGSDDHHMMGYDGEKSIQRFDSNSMKPDRSRGFGSDDESDPFGAFGDSGPFSAGTAKQTNVWSAF